MTANTMQRVEVAGRSILLSQAEIEAFERRFAEVLASNVPAAPEEPPESVTFTGSDAAILAASKPAAPVVKQAMPFWQSQRFLIAVGGLLLTLLIIGVSSLAEWSQGSGTRQLPLGISTATATATTAATTVAAEPTTAAHEFTVLAYFDYANPDSVTEITTTGIRPVDGQADSWRLVSLSDKRPSVWIALADMPAGVPVADPLPNLAPRPTSPPQPRQPAAQTGGSSGGDPPAQCLVDADLRFRTEYDVKRPNGDGTTDFLGHAFGGSCYSQAEADANAAQEEAAIMVRHAANMTAAPAIGPSATPLPLTQPTPAR